MVVDVNLDDGHVNDHVNDDVELLVGEFDADGIANTEVDDDDDDRQ